MFFLGDVRVLNRRLGFRNGLRALAAALALMPVGCSVTTDDGSASRGGIADLVLTGGRLITLDEQHPAATALAARAGRIVALGDDDEIRSWIGDETEVIDLDGKTAIPGFVEGHAHFVNLGNALLEVDLTVFESWEAMVSHLAEVAADRPAGTWIVGRGWHQEKWNAPPPNAVEGYPVHAMLSAAVPDHPVALTHASGHAGMVNAAAMRLAGIDRNTPNPPGGEILHDAAGEPTGALRETAHDAVEALVAASQSDDVETRFAAAVEAAGRECLENGVTSFQDAGSTFETVERLQRLAEAGELPVRLWVMLKDDNDVLAERLPGFSVKDAGDGFLTVGGIKRWLDGALGSHGAWLLEPYHDLPSSSGLNIVPLDEMAVTAQLARDHDLQLCVHAIGDRANRETLDLFEGTFGDREVLAARRWRVEHAQHLALDDVERFAGLGVVASMQAVHCTSDGPWVPQRLGDRRSADGAYVWRKLLDSGAVVINGTDAPVENIDPIANYVAAVTRRMRTGDPFFVDQAMTRMEALEAATSRAAWAAFEEDDKGTLTVGKLADVTVLSQDLLTVPDADLPNTRVLMTIIGGELRFRAE